MFLGNMKCIWLCHQYSSFICICWKGLGRWNNYSRKMDPFTPDMKCHHYHDLFTKEDRAWYQTSSLKISFKRQVLSWCWFIVWIKLGNVMKLVLTCYVNTLHFLQTVICIPFADITHVIYWYHIGIFASRQYRNGATFLCFNQRFVKSTDSKFTGYKRNNNYTLFNILWYSFQGIYKFIRVSLLVQRSSIFFCRQGGPHGMHYADAWYFCYILTAVAHSTTRHDAKIRSQ